MHEDDGVMGSAKAEPDGPDGRPVFRFLASIVGSIGILSSVMMLSLFISGGDIQFVPMVLPGIIFGLPLLRFAITGKFRFVNACDVLSKATRRLAGYASLGEEAPPSRDDGKKP
jgi:hypothetical protein